MYSEVEKKDTLGDRRAEQSLHIPHDGNPRFGVLPILESKDVEFARSEQPSVYYCILHNQQTRTSDCEEGENQYNELRKS